MPLKGDYYQILAALFTILKPYLLCPTGKDLVILKPSSKNNHINNVLLS